MPLCREFDLIISPDTDGAVLRQASDVFPAPTLEELVRFLYGFGDMTCPRCFAELTYHALSGTSVVNGLDVEQDAEWRDCKSCGYVAPD